MAEELAVRKMGGQRTLVEAYCIGYKLNTLLLRDQNCVAQIHDHSPALDRMLCETQIVTLAASTPFVAIVHHDAGQLWKPAMWSQHVA